MSGAGGTAETTLSRMPLMLEPVCVEAVYWFMDRMGDVDGDHCAENDST